MMAFCSLSLIGFILSQWSEEDEISDYKQNSEWMEECQDGLFETWYDKIAQADPENQRKVIKVLILTWFWSAYSEVEWERCLKH